MKTYETIYQLLLEKKDYLSGEEIAAHLGISRTAVWKAIQQLEKKGVAILSSRKLGYKLYKGDLLLPSVIAQELGLPVELVQHSQSTQQDAKLGIEKGQIAPCLYLAENQQAAHGRFGREFFTSETGGIYMTLHLSPHVTFQDLPTYTLFVAAAIVKGIQSLTGKSTQIKWVNDIYLDGKKIAGILTEAISSVETQTVSHLIIGVGLNFFIEAFPPSLKDKAGNLFDQSPTTTRTQLIIAIWKAFFETPTHELLQLYKEASLVLGREVQFTENHIQFNGVAEHITDKGELVLTLSNGQTKTLSSGEISLTSW